MIAGCSLFQPEPEPDQPNVVLIVIDTLRAESLGTYGGRVGVSDELDALAARGIVFEDVTAASSWTRPSMGAMLTGQYPRDLGLYRERMELLPDDATTLAEQLKAHGYRTLGYTANPNINSSYGFHVGFDVYLDSLVVFDWMPGGEKPPERAGAGLHSANQLFDAALRDIQADPDAPTYLQLSIMEVHEWHIFERGLIRPEAREQFKDGNWFSGYDQAIWQASRDIDAFIAKLRALPGWEDAWVVITSDHGEGIGAHPAVELSDLHGRHLYTTQTRVPLLITRLDDSLEPQRITTAVRGLDTAPTILDLVDAPAFTDSDGVSLRPLMDGESVQLPPYFVTETAFRGHDKSALVGRDWRYYIHRDGHSGMDPLELQPVGIHENGTITNQLDDHGDMAASMQAYFDEWAKAHPRRTPTTAKGEIDPTELEQLQSLGYLN